MSLVVIMLPDALTPCLTRSSAAMIFTTGSIHSQITFNVIMCMHLSSNVSPLSCVHKKSVVPDLLQRGHPQNINTFSKKTN